MPYSMLQAKDRERIDCSCEFYEGDKGKGRKELAGLGHGESREKSVCKTLQIKRIKRKLKLSAVCFLLYILGHRAIYFFL